MGSYSIPKISVITTFYNAEAYIGNCIESLLSQTFKNYEHLLIDDGSTDSSKQLVKNYKDHRIKLLNPGKIGRAKALNLGLQKASADYIAILDADDISLSNRLEVQYNEFLNDKSLSLVCGNVLLIDKNNNLKGKLSYPEKHENLIKYIFNLNPFPHSSVMFDKKKIMHVGGYNNRCEKSIDFNFYLELLYNKAKFKCLQKPLIKLLIDDDTWGSKDNSILQHKYGIIGLVNYYQKINGEKGIFDLDDNAWEKFLIKFDKWFYKNEFDLKLKAKYKFRKAYNLLYTRNYYKSINFLFSAIKSDPFFFTYKGLGFKFPKDVIKFIRLVD